MDTTFIRGRDRRLKNIYLLGNDFELSISLGKEDGFYFGLLQHGRYLVFQVDFSSGNGGIIGSYKI